MDKGFKIISKEDRFQVPARFFAIGASSSGYTLQWSVDGVVWDDLDEVDANTNWTVNHSTPGYWFKLKDNTDTTVKIVY